MRAPLLRLSAAAAAIALAAGCSTDGDEGPDAGADAAQAEAAADDDGTDPGGDDGGEVEEAEPRLALDVPRMTLRTPAEGVGPRPELAWEPVDGAAGYTVTVYTADDGPLWGATTEETSIVLGGFTEPPQDDARVGPVLADGMRWEVLARDEQGGVVAQSGLRPIAP